MWEEAEGPQLFGRMIHVCPFKTNEKQVWNH